MSINARENFLKCFFKINDANESAVDEYKEQAEQAVHFLMRKQSNSSVTHYLNAKWQLKERMLERA
jgi:hypothetical protein